MATTVTDLVRASSDDPNPLILCNTGDARVPIVQSYKLANALRDGGVPVQFVAYPLPGHFPGDPVHRDDVYRRWIDWMVTRFEVPRDAPVPTVIGSGRSSP